MSQFLINDRNLELICRFCLNEDSSDLTSISNSIEVYCRNQAIKLEHVIVTCIGLSISQDELPKWICKECISQLTVSYTFREKCLETVKYLKDIINERIDVCEDKFGKQPDNCSTADIDTEFQSTTEQSNESKLSLVTERSSHFHFHRISNGPFKCDICGSLLKSRRTLVYHMRTLHIVHLTDKSEAVPEKRSDVTESNPPIPLGDNDTLFPFKCDICGSGLKNMEAIKDHMQKFHIDNNYLKRCVDASNPFECEICRNGYKNRKSLSRHRIRVHGIFKSHRPTRSAEPKTKSKVKRWQVCPICGVMRKDMKCHIATHESDRLFKCEICGSDLKTAVNLKRHRRRVHTEDRYVLDYNSNYSSLKNINTKFHRQYPCELCKVAFKAPFQLKRHNRKHTQERNYACTYCEKRFIDKATLERHFVVHFRERNVECNFCGKRFQTKLGLQNHVGIHTLERKFKCGLCSLAFITSSAASVHRRTHRNKLDNQFHCGDCGMKFQEVIMLKMHLRASGHRFSVEKS